MICFACAAVTACGTSGTRSDGGGESEEAKRVATSLANLQNQCTKLREQWKVNHRQIRQYAAEYQGVRRGPNVMRSINSFAYYNRKVKIPQRKQKSIIESVKELSKQERKLVGSVTHCKSSGLYVRTLTRTVR